MPRCLQGALALLVLVLGSTPALAEEAGEPGEEAGQPGEEAGALLRLMPEDTALVVTASAAQLAQSAPGQALLTALLDHGAAAAVANLRTRAGFDIHRDLRAVAIGMASDFGASRRVWIIADGRFDQARFLEMIHASSSTRVRRTHRGVAYIEIDKKNEVAFLGRHLAVTPRGIMPQLIDTHRRRARSAADSAPLMELIGRGDTTGAVWGAFLLPEDLRQTIAREAGGHSVNAVVLAVSLRAGMDIHAQVDTSSPTAATAISALARRLRAQAAGQPILATLGLGTALANAAIQVTGARIHLRAQVSRDDLAALERQLRARTPQPPLPNVTGTD